MLLSRAVARSERTRPAAQLGRAVRTTGKRSLVAAMLEDLTFDLRSIAPPSMAAYSGLRYECYMTVVRMG